MRIRPFGIIALCFILLITSCNLPFGPGDVLGQDQQEEGEADLPGGFVEIPESLEPGSTFILVVDPSGDPIPNARIGDSELYTDWNGVAVGVVNSTSAGWLSVQASGYATRYTRAITEWEGYPVSLAILSPLGSLVNIETEGSTTLTIENTNREQILVNLEPEAVNESQGLLSWSYIPMNQLDARFGDRSAGDDLLLQEAFAVEAINLEGTPLEIDPERGANLQINWDPNREEIPTLGQFDPSTGAWELLTDVCQRNDENQVICTLLHFSEFGFFGHSSGGDEWDQGGDEDDDFADDFGSALDNAMGGSAAGGGSAGGGAAGGDGAEGGGTEGGLTGGLDGLSNAGDGSGTEVDKMTALIAAGLAIDNGLSNLANQYLDQARAAIEKMANKLLKDPSCGTVYEMATVASQAFLVGGLESLGQQLLQRAEEILKRCGVWYGTIEYTFQLQPTWPHAERWKFESGSNTWKEIHDVRIFVDPKTGAIDGESHVKLSFGTATYRYEKPSPCGPVRNDHEAKTDPGSGSAVLLFDGTFDGDKFTIGDLRVDQNKPVILQHHAWYSRTFAEPIASPPTCPPVTTEEISTTLIAEYTSQLIHGFLGQPEPPSLMEMLNSGNRTMYDDRLTRISGEQTIAYDVGRNLSPLLPVVQGTVNWRFNRVITTP